MDFDFSFDFYYGFRYIYFLNSSIDFDESQTPEQINREKHFYTIGINTSIKSLSVDQ